MLWQSNSGYPSRCSGEYVSIAYMIKDTRINRQLFFHREGRSSKGQLIFYNIEGQSFPMLSK